jgi:hypothetical protein
MARRMPPERPSDTELARRLTAQLLTGPPAADPLAVCERLLAVQGQDPRGARLAVRARTCGLTAADVDRALTEERSLLITWLNRGTLHLVRSEDYPWLQALTTPQLRTGNERRLAQEGVTPTQADKAVQVVAREIGAHGPRTREELRDAVRRARLPTAGQALVHILFRAALDGLIVRGPMRGKQHCYVLVADWLPRPPRFDRDRGLAELGHRFLAGHAPADDRDLAKWAGITLADARRALTGARPPRRTYAPLPPVKLLGAFDPVLLGWVDRSPLLAPRWSDQVISGGMFRPCVLATGRVSGTWTLTAGEVRVACFGRVAQRALRAEIADVGRYLHGTSGRA